MELKDFKNRHFKETIFVIGSGKSIDFYPDKNMFKNFITIGVNLAVNHFPVNYMITQHHAIIEQCALTIKEKCPDTIMFASEYDCGSCVNSIIQPDPLKYVLYKHNNQPYLDFTPDAINFISDNHLFVGCTTIITAVSLAIHMGATNIVLVGVDAGTINGESNYIGYYSNNKTESYQHYHSVATNSVLKMYRNELAKRGINIISLSPFLDFSLEGNKYDNELRAPS